MFLTWRLIIGLSVQDFELFSVPVFAISAWRSQGVVFDALLKVLEHLFLLALVDENAVSKLLIVIRRFKILVTISVFMHNLVTKPDSA